MVHSHPFCELDTFERIEGNRRIVGHFDFSGLQHGRDLVPRCSLGHMVLKSIHFKLQQISKGKWPSLFKHQIRNVLSHGLIKPAQFISPSSTFILVVVKVVKGVIVTGCHSDVENARTILIQRLFFVLN